MNFKQTVIPFLFAAIPLAGSAADIADSTGAGRATRSLVIPTYTLTRDAVCGLVDCIPTPSNPSVSPTGIPPGFTELKMPMGSRDLGWDAPGIAAANYYYTLGYPSAILDHLAAPNYCNYNDSPRVLSATYCNGLDGSCASTTTHYFLCEPLGTRSTLVKTVSTATLTLLAAQINTFAIAGTIGVEWTAVGHICQTNGYPNVNQSSITFWDRGSGCTGDRITKWNGSAFYTDSACYNRVLSGVQCWK